jgi:hypothetical protein
METKISFGLSRRAVIGTAAAALALYACPFCAGPAHAYHDGPVGCFLYAQNAKQLAQETKFVRSSGDSEVDDLCTRAGDGLRRLFQVSPDFAYFDDSNPSGAIEWGYKGNAFATTARMSESSDGSVLFGLTLLRLVSARNAMNRRWKVSVVSILAHEWGHIAQFKRQMLTPGRAQELQADFLAGWFLAKIGGDAEDSKQGVWQLFGMGDRLPYNHPQHHGTPVQRAGAIARGFEAAASAATIDAALAQARF